MPDFLILLFNFFFNFGIFKFQFLLIFLSHFALGSQLGNSIINLSHFFGIVFGNGHFAFASVFMQVKKLLLNCPSPFFDVLQVIQIFCPLHRQNQTLLRLTNMFDLCLDIFQIHRNNFQHFLIGQFFFFHHNPSFGNDNFSIKFIELLSDFKFLFFQNLIATRIFDLR